MTARAQSSSPGPWRIVGPRSDGKTFIKTDTENLAIAALSFSDNKRGQANACLIAAAPEMLEALEALVGDWGVTARAETTDECKAARAAIAKARGD